MPAVMDKALDDTVSELVLPTRMTLRDVREAAASLGRKEIRYLVDYYYMSQEHRLAANNQVRALTEAGEPSRVIEWLAGTQTSVENQVKSVLDQWTRIDPSASWARSIVGIGPVLSAGFLAHLDITVGTNVSKFWAFAGQDPNRKWLKGQKRPFNGRLKVLCWKTGESFVKTQNNARSFYGPLYRERRALEEERNNSGALAEQARQKLIDFKIGKETEAYKWYSSGKLPPAHLYERAKRWTVQLFLSHLWHVMYTNHYGTEPPAPWIIAHGGHTDFIPPPNWPFDHTVKLK